jgi:hypothetical protein
VDITLLVEMYSAPYCRSGIIWCRLIWNGSRSIGGQDCGVARMGVDYVTHLQPSALGLSKAQLESREQLQFFNLTTNLR